MGENSEQCTPAEATILWEYHTREANYYLACKRSNIENSRTIPLYTFGETQTKQGWLNKAAGYDRLRKYHRQRARVFVGFVDK